MDDSKKVPPVSFPLLQSEKHFHTRMDAKKPVTQPKKKLTPELLENIARVQGTKRKIYKSKEDRELEILKSLQKEIQDICAELKKSESLSDDKKQAIKERLLVVISDMLKFDSSYSKKYDLLKK